jgi:KDO2-lipid IV(A) lauroyltransferase
VRGLVRLLPVNATCWLVERLAPLYALVRVDLARSVRNAMTYLFMDRDLGRPKDRIVREWIRRDLRKAVDDLVMRRLDITALREHSTIEGLHHLDDALARGRGVLVVSGHFHANRLSKFLLRRSGYSIVSVRNPVPYSAGLGRLGNWFVAPAYGRFLSRIVEDEIPATPGKVGMLVLRKLRENRIVNMHIDVRLATECIPMPFFGVERFFPVGFLHLAETTGAPLVRMLCTGDSSGLHIRFEEPVCFSGRSGPDELQARMRPFLERLEAWLTEYPEEWEIWSRGLGRRLGLRKNREEKNERNT